jgi:hypothetical protein
LFEEGSSISYMDNNHAIRQSLANHETLKTLLRNDELQVLLKEDEDCQDLIKGVYRMVQEGSNHTRREDPKHHMCIMDSVSDTPDFLYFHLRNNPTLCDRSNSSSAIVQQQDSSSIAEQGEEELTFRAATQTESDHDENARPMRKRKSPDYLRY